MTLIPIVLVVIGGWFVYKYKGEETPQQETPPAYYIIPITGEVETSPSWMDNSLLITAVATVIAFLICCL